jgi:hypothetical protein
LTASGPGATVSGEGGEEELAMPARKAAATGRLFAVLLGVAAPALAAGDAWTANLYLQEAFPKQTRTNRQIAEINAAFGTHFEDWDDIHNLSLGGQLFRRVAEHWKVGVEVDYSQGEVAGHATIDTEAGPAELDFEQRYSIFADALAAAHFLPCPRCRRVEPFVLLAAGVAYEKDRTRLALANAYLDEGLRVDNDGFYPVYTAGVGLDVPLSKSRGLALQLGAAYFWGRLQHRVAARGSLAPAPEVLADTDSTGPNYWVGLSWRFGGAR